MKIAYISNNSDQIKTLKQSFPELSALWATNILEYQQNHGGKPIEALVFSDLPPTLNDFKNILSFIRGKPAWRQLPIALLCKDTSFQFPFIVSDQRLRTYSQKEGIFLALMNFIGSLGKQNLSSDQWLQSDKIEEDFIKAISNKLGQNTQFVSRIANDDETHEEFFCQKSDEISSNLLWIKFSARMLSQGSEEFQKTFSRMTEEEIQETTSNILSLIFQDFKKELLDKLQQEGAVFFCPSDSLPIQERSPFLKNAKSQFQIFESSVCTLLLESIRYI